MLTKRSNLPLIVVCLCTCTFPFSSEALSITVPITINPNPLNLGSQGVMTCDVDLPEPYVFTDVNTSTITLEGIPPESCSPQAGGTSFSCKFNRSAVVWYILATIPPGADSIEMTLSFYLTDGTTYFEGSDIVYIKVGDYSTLCVTSFPGEGKNMKIGGDSDSYYVLINTFDEILTALTAAGIVSKIKETTEGVEYLGYPVDLCVLFVNPDDFYDSEAWDAEEMRLSDTYDF